MVEEEVRQKASCLIYLVNYCSGNSPLHPDDNVDDSSDETNVSLFKGR